MSASGNGRESVKEMIWKYVGVAGIQTTGRGAQRRAHLISTFGWKCTKVSLIDRGVAWISEIRSKSHSTRRRCKWLLYNHSCTARRYQVIWNENKSYLKKKEKNNVFRKKNPHLGRELTSLRLKGHCRHRNLLQLRRRRIKAHGTRSIAHWCCSNWKFINFTRIQCDWANVRHF